MTGQGAAVVTWTQQSRACLYREGYYLGCWDGAGRVSVAFGGAQTDWTARPHANDVYTLETDGAVSRARARWWLWLARA
jgi:hypothetical protein